MDEWTPDILKAQELQRILDNEVFQEAVFNLKADLLLRTYRVREEEAILDIHKQINAIDALTIHLEYVVRKLNGE